MICPDCKKPLYYSGGCLGEWEHANRSRDCEQVEATQSKRSDSVEVSWMPEIQQLRIAIQELTKEVKRSRNSDDHLEGY